MSRTVVKPESILAIVGSGFSAVDRDYVHRKGISHFCAHLLCTSGNLVYLQRRKKNRRRNPDHWTSTVSGHITIEDATAGGVLAANEHSARNALQHEAFEELGRALPIERAIFIGQVAAPSIGQQEVCNCTALVFTLNYDHVLEQISSDEVEEVRPFQVPEIEAAIRGHGLLKGSDRQSHGLADNFMPVFELFLRHTSDVWRGAGA